MLALVDEDGVSLGDRVRSHQAPWGGLATLMQPLGGEVPVAVSIGAVEGPGRRVVGRVLVLRDLRREHEVERMKAEFLSRAGHELRTPLTGIMGNARVLLRRQVEPAQARQYYEEIDVAALKNIKPDDDKKPFVLGTYELDGDKFKLCVAAPGKDRPTEFTSKEGSGQTLSTWEREKKK